MKITTPRGSTLEDKSQYGDRVIILDHPGLPDQHRNAEIGRIVEDRGELAFQSAPYALFGLGPEVLRAIAEIIEGLSE